VQQFTCGELAPNHTVLGLAESLLRFAKKRKNRVFALQKHNLECSTLGEPSLNSLYFKKFQVKLKLDTPERPFKI
jgi:hypothetical protein